MQIKLEIKGLDKVKSMLKVASSQLPYATALALNAVADEAKKAVQAEMRQAFESPTPWVLNSLYVQRATKQKPEAVIEFKDRKLGETARTMVFPHVEGGPRRFKGMELRLQRAGLLPAGWFVVPGQAAQLDAFGNMNKGQITQLLNVLGTYTEAGYNKADDRTRARLAKGGKRAQYGQYGFVWVVVRVGDARWGRVHPGVYQRVQTAFGSSLKPVLVFVQSAQYKRRLDFYGTVRGVHAKSMSRHLVESVTKAMRTARYSSQGSLL